VFGFELHVRSAVFGNACGHVEQDPAGSRFPSAISLLAIIPPYLAATQYLRSSSHAGLLAAGSFLALLNHFTESRSLQLTNTLGENAPRRLSSQI